MIVLSNCPSPSSAKYSAWTGMSTESAAVSALSVSSPRLGGQSMTMKSYFRRASSSAFLSTRSRS